MQLQSGARRAGDEPAAHRPPQRLRGGVSRVDFFPHLGFRELAGPLASERQIILREADVRRFWHHASDHAIVAGVNAVGRAGDLFSRGEASACLPTRSGRATS